MAQEPDPIARSIGEIYFNAKAAEQQVMATIESERREKARHEWREEWMLRLTAFSVFASVAALVIAVVALLAN